MDWKTSTLLSSLICNYKAGELLEFSDAGRIEVFLTWNFKSKYTVTYFLGMLNYCVASVLRKWSPLKNVYILIQLIMLFLLKTLAYIYMFLKYVR